ncbi:MAG: PQQ-dependent sugar dehydrogenase [Chitinophagaceae bacterium]|nr:PQQ-dependent sugar dehydrogenase [Chitinophagaceae bacterium]
MKLFLSAALLSFILLSHPTIAQPVLSLSPVITGLSQPMQVVHAGDNSGRIFIVQKGGIIRVFDKAYASLGTFLTVTGITSSGERGLLSLAFHPDYINNGLFYVYYTNGTGSLELARYKVSANPNVADATSKVILKTILHPTNTNHNGGELHFGPEGYLYLSTGDGGGGGDLPNNAQTTTVLLGKMLRFAVDTSSVAPYYSVPADNPFANEVFAYGLRNPFRWSFDKLNYDMWIGDVGQDSYEEINHKRYDSTKGVNYGWRCYEGNNTYNTTGCGPISNYSFPVLAYSTPSPSGSITGGTVYRGETYLSLQGYYVGTDFYTGRFFKIKYDSLAHTYDTSSQLITPTGISDFGETENGELYATCLNNGNVYRVVSNGSIQYTFTGNGNWDVAGNWSNNTIPPSTLPAGCVIAIRPVTNGECVLNVQQTIPAGTKIIIENNKQFRINGNLTVQ